MSSMSLTKIRFQGGVWEGHVTGAASKPNIKVLHRDQAVDGVELNEGSGPDLWELKIAVPTASISEGVQTFLIIDDSSDVTLGEFTIIAGEAAVDDMRAEVDLLRAELDMLKRAFRRHCVETT